MHVRKDVRNAMTVPTMKNAIMIMTWRVRDVFHVWENLDVIFVMRAHVMDVEKDSI